MGDELMRSIVTVLLAVTGIAFVATLVSKNANTAQVIQAGAGGFSTVLGTALSPVTGASQSFGGFSGGAQPLNLSL
jgi:hypothetical protein